MDYERQARVTLGLAEPGAEVKVSASLDFTGKPRHSEDINTGTAGTGRLRVRPPVLTEVPGYGILCLHAPTLPPGHRNLARSW
jgi:hypothetical protein